MLTSSSQPILYRELERSELQSYYQEGKLMRNEGEGKEKLPENCVKNTVLNYDQDSKYGRSILKTATQELLSKNCVDCLGN